MQGSVTVSFGRRSATVNFNQVDAQTLSASVARAEAMAKLAPENPEYMPPPSASEFDEPVTFSERTAAAGPGALADWIRPVIEASREAGVVGAGFLSRKAGGNALANSNGLFTYQRQTTCGFSMTARTRDGAGSGWASTEVTSTDDFDPDRVARRAIQKAVDSKKPVELTAGRRTVLLEPAAVRDLVSLLVWKLVRRRVDEKRSFLNQLSEKEVPIGESLFGTSASIASDPLDWTVPCATHSYGQPLKRTAWIENGVLRNLHVGRFWAKKTGIDPLPGPGNIIFSGGTTAMEKLMSAIDDGVLITRLWYIRMVKPQSLLYTGLTRDGTFRIENGSVSGPVKNFRFNESPVNLLRQMIASGIPQRVLSGEWSVPMSVPPLIVGDFNLSSISDAS